jgi:hypothetical protein
LPDAYHELGHILLFREEKRLVHPALTIVDRWYDHTITEGRKLNWPAGSLEEVDGFRHLWRLSWLLEFGSDLIATYLVGPAFGWCNIRTSTNLGGELFAGSDSHPADDARASAVGMMLEEIGCGAEARAIRQRWCELVALSTDAPPPRYELAYPAELLRELAESFHAECGNLGMRAFHPERTDAAPVTAAVNDAWREFREHPDTFGQYEESRLKSLIERLG